MSAVNDTHRQSQDCDYAGVTYRLTVGKCIGAYTSLSDMVFGKKSQQVNIRGKLHDHAFVSTMKY
jgi:hypothetical protein